MLLLIDMVFNKKPEYFPKENLTKASSKKEKNI